MSSIAQVGRSDRHDSPLGYFTSWRSAVASVAVLAVVVALLVVDLVLPLLG
jgi:hypothetical protein